MCSRLRGKIVIFFSYVSVIAIGLLIYLVIFLFVEKHQNSSSKSDDTDFITPPQNLTRSDDNAATAAPNDSAFINELPSEIDSAITVIESPIEEIPIIKKDSFPRDFIVEAKVLNVRSQQSTKAKIIKRFKKGAIISIIEIDGEWAKLENGGFAFLPLLKEKD